MGFAGLSRRSLVEVSAPILRAGLLVGMISSHGLSADSPVQHAAAGESTHADKAEIENLVIKLRRVWMPAEVDPIVDELVRNDDAAVEAINNQLKGNTPDFGMVHNCVRVLERVN